MPAWPARLWSARWVICVCQLSRLERELKKREKELRETREKDKERRDMERRRERESGEKEQSRLGRIFDKEG